MERFSPPKGRIVDSSQDTWFVYWRITSSFFHAAFGVGSAIFMVYKQFSLWFLSEFFSGSDTSSSVAIRKFLLKELLISSGVKVRPLVPCLIACGLFFFLSPSSHTHRTSIPCLSFLNAKRFGSSSWQVNM
jgi:hypothetical protein